MREFANRTAGKAVTTAAVVSPVTEQALIDYLVLPATDPNLAGLLKSATGAVIRYLGYDLLARDWVLKHWDWPTSGTTANPTLSGQAGYAKREIVLPYANILSVDSVLVYGTASTDYETRTDSIVFGSSAVIFSNDGDNQDPAIEVGYSAGFGATDDDVPEEIKEAILLLAAFMYEHRGACSSLNQIKESGAESLLIPWRNPELML